MVLLVLAQFGPPYSSPPLCGLGRRVDRPTRSAPSGGSWPCCAAPVRACPGRNLRRPARGGTVVNFQPLQARRPVGAGPAGRSVARPGGRPGPLSTGPAGRRPAAARSGASRPQPHPQAPPRRLRRPRHRRRSPPWSWDCSPPACVSCSCPPADRRPAGRLRRPPDPPAQRRRRARHEGPLPAPAAQRRAEPALLRRSAN